MNRITLEEIEKATGGRILSGSGSQEILEICTDSRKAKPGDLFIPIIGEVHDAHKFIPQVVEKGASAVLVSREEAVEEGISVILVEDTTRAMQDLAAWYLDRLNLKKIAVTGSVGKTSTRDMVYFILKEKYVTGTTAGSLNSEIGVPMTIFTFDDSMEAAVLEVGMDRFGEIHRLVDIIRPDIGIITNVGISHIENLGSREGILKAKMEIVDYFDQENTLVINSSNDMLHQLGQEGPYNVIRVGTEASCGYYVHDIEDRGGEGVSYKLTEGGRTYSIDLAIPGAHNALNSALAMAACRCFGVTVEEAKRGLSAMELTGKRLTIKETGKLTVIDDTYNAAPDSMKSAIDTLMHTEGGRRVAILGGMNELGADSRVYHAQVGQYAAQQQVDLLITIGKKAFDIGQGARAIDPGAERTRVLHFDTKEGFYAAQEEILRAGDVVMVKGSRTMEMELVVDKILKEQE